MANTDNVRGLWPIGHLCGGEIRASEYTVTTSATIYQGDIVELDAAGTVGVAEAGDATAVVGVSNGYVSSAAAGTKIMVFDDPNIIFGLQQETGGTVAAADVGLSADANTYLAGSSTTKMSAVELSSTLGTTAAQFLILGKIETADNDWGENCKLRVIFNEHRYKGAGSAGV